MKRKKERLIDWGDIRRQWNKWARQQVGIRSTLSSRPDTSLDTWESERGTEGICVHRIGGRACVSVCAPFNLFIYLSLAAIMAFIPSLSLCLSLSGDGGLVFPVCRLIIKPEFSHQTLIRPITRVTESVGRLMWASDKDAHAPQD